MRKLFQALAALSGMFSSTSAVSQPVRSEVPVREVTLSDGTRRYGVMIRVGNTNVEAGLDTGSTGLRILPGVLSDGDARPTLESDTYSYGAGAKLDGLVARAPIGVGTLRGTTTVQLVRRVGCSDESHGCAAGSIPLEQYGIQGNGLPREGFKAILGVNMADADVTSVLRGIGAQRWIIELPRPNNDVLGRIILNPSDAETTGFVELPILQRFAKWRGGAHDAVRGCLVNDATGLKLCGALMLDTGAPGLRVAGPGGVGPTWPNETPATLLFADGSGQGRLAEKIMIGRRAQATRLTFDNTSQAPITMIYTGLTPYFAFTVLYDPSRGVVGFKPRPPGQGSPQPTDVSH